MAVQWYRASRISVPTGTAAHATNTRVDGVHSTPASNMKLSSRNPVSHTYLLVGPTCWYLLAVPTCLAVSPVGYSAKVS